MKGAGGSRGGGRRNGAFYLYEPSLGAASDWWRQRHLAGASRWSSLDALVWRSTPERNVLMQDWPEID